MSRCQCIRSGRGTVSLEIGRQPALAEIGVAEGHLEEHQRMLGRIDQAENAPDQAARLAALRSKAALLEGAKEYLSTKKAEAFVADTVFAEAETRLLDVRNRRPSKAPDTCPHCGCEVMRQDGVLECYVPPENPSTLIELGVR